MPITLTTDDMQKRKNDVKARTTLLLSLPDEHQLRFTKGSETLEQTFNRLQVIVNQLEFMDIEIEQDDLNQKFLTSLAPEWLMHMIVWRNMSDLDTMSLDDLYNYLKVYEPEVQKKSESNSQNMDFISSVKHSSRNEEVNTASVSTASTNVSPASTNIRVASISQETACAYIASQSSGSQIKFEDINQIDEDDMEEMDIKWNMALLSMRADRAPKSQDRGRRDNYRQGSKVEEQAPKALMAIDGDMSWTGLPEFKDDTVTDYSRHSPAIESTSDDGQNRNPSKTKASPSTISPKPFIKFVKANDSPTKSKTDKVETAKKPPVKYAEQYKKPTKKPNVRGNQRNWNNLKSHQLGPNFVMKKKACFNCGNFNHLAYDCCKWVDHGRSWVKNNNTHKSMSPRPAIHRPYRPPIRHVRPNMNVAQPKRTSFQKPTHSYNKRHFQRTLAMRSQFRDPRVATVNKKFPTGNTKFSIANMGNKGKAVKASACWFWKPSQNLSNKGPNSNSVSVMFKKYTYIDTQGTLNGCSRHMTGNISYLSDYEPFDRGYVSFGQGGCKSDGKGTIKTGKLEFENVYFVKDLKYNLFSVSQICDNNNNVLFTDLECIVLGRDFKLLDDANVLLRTPRQYNMYSINLNNIVPHKDLTCLVAKASADEGMLWHRRLGHLNFKTMNRCDNGGEFRNKEMDDFCSQKRIKREFSNARNPQQNGVAERRNRTLIEAVRTMLADAKLPVTFWAEAVNTACYVQNRGEGSATPTEPHHTPSPEAQQTSPTTHSSPTLPPVTTAHIPTVTPSDTPHLRQYTKRARIAQSSALLPVADEPASPLRDVSQGEACPTVSSLDAEQDRVNIAKTSTLLYESTSRVPSLAADEGSLQLQIQELTDLCTILQRPESSCWRIEKEGLQNDLEMMPQSRGQGKSVHTFCFSDRNEMHRFGKTIGNDPDGVMSV
uniref:Ribonuclease H-like domain-containing protein n=1 Tax=Tanacetum cinerariifolium TaxID=118510 RepID=A0A6L2KWQ8_TANCI|nr:ribonuclease H-like domain-containing protein [Tanacetum cinerariifolium]